MPSYFIRNLLPRRHAEDVNHEPLSKVLLSLTWIQWAQFLTGWLAWTCDAIDFFNVALSVTNLQHQFHQAEPSSITTAITLTLLVRSIGAVSTSSYMSRRYRLPIFERWKPSLQCFPYFSIERLVHYFRLNAAADSGRHPTV